MIEPKKIVVFAANGEIGEKTAHDIAAQMESSGNQVVVQLITRTGTITDAKTGKTRPRTNIGQGIANEVRENFVHVDKADNADASKKISMARAFGPIDHPGHPMWDQKSPESLKDALKDADVIIVPAGVPRKLKEDGTAPTRSELLGQNAEAASQIGTVIGQWAPPMTPVINCMNPSDNAGTIIEETCRQEWDKKDIPTDARPAHKVVTMGGSLDESRLRVFVAETVNKALLDAGQRAEEIIPAHVEGHVYGQHGPKMIIDRSSIRINGQPYEAFLEQKGLKDKIPAITKEFENKTVNGGANLLADLDQTARFSPAKRLAEIAFAALFADKPHTLTAAVLHKENGDSRAVASGARVRVSKKGIEICPEWTNGHVQSQDRLAEAIKESRKEIIADQAGHELVAALKGSAISRAGNDITLTLDNSVMRLETSAKLVEEALKLEVGSVQSNRGAPASVTFKAENDAVMDRVKKLAVANGLLKKGEAIPERQNRLG